MQDLSYNRLAAVGLTDVILSQERAPQNGERVAVTVTNTSTGGEVVSLAIDAAAVNLQGIVLYPGGSWSSSKGEGYFVTQKSIHAIADGAGGAIAISERVVFNG